MKLYRFPAATCAAKVLMALEEKGAVFEDIVLDRADLAQPWYRALNPNGVVPTLVVGDVAIVESSVILNYIEDALPGARLRPLGAVDRARMNLWLKLVDDLLIHLATMTYAISSRQRYLGQSPAERDAYYASIPDPYVRQSRRDAIELGLAAPGAREAMAALVALQARAACDLAAAGYLCGTFSLADIALAPFAWRMEALGLLDPSPANAPFHGWWRRIQERPSFQCGVVASTPAEVTATLRAASARQSADIARLRAD